jgi:hypothetical protein
MAMTILLGVAILTPIQFPFSNATIFSFSIYLSIFLIAAIIGIWSINRFSKSLQVCSKRQDFMDLNDWIIDRVSCFKGEKVKISVTNTDLKISTTIPQNAIAFKIIDDDNNIIHSEPVKNPITLVNYGTFSWLWNTSADEVIPDKIYRVLPYGRDSPIRRSIVVYKKEGKPKEKT